MGSRKINKKINFSFFILIIWFIFSRAFSSLLVLLLTLVVHEIGHFFVARKLGYKLYNWSLSAFGVSLNYKEKFFQPRDEIFIAIAGPIANFTLAILCVSLWWLFPEFYNFSSQIVRQSILLGLFNLLPCYPMDGGRVFAGFFSELFSRKKAIKITFFVNILIAIIFFILFLISFFINFNPTLSFCGIFMIISAFENKKESCYQQINIFNKKFKNYSKPAFCVIRASQSLASVLKHIEVNRFSIFIVVFANNKTLFVDEAQIQVLALRYSLDMTLENIFRQGKA